MAHVLVDKRDASPSNKKLKKPNNYVNINKETNIVDEQVFVASKSYGFFLHFWMNCKFTPLFESLHSIMGRLVSDYVITLPPIRPLISSTTSIMNFDSKASFSIISILAMILISFFYLET